MFRQQEIRLDESLSSTRRTVELFWADVRQNLDHLALEWTVRGMARRCGMGVTNFIHHTKQLTNMTPMQYLNHCRLTAAADLLRGAAGAKRHRHRPGLRVQFEPVLRHAVSQPFRTQTPERVP